MGGYHAAIAPSSLHITVRCPAHVQLSAPHLDAPPTPETLEGEAGHWVAAQMAEGVDVPHGLMTAQGVPVDQDMIDGGALWRDNVGLYGHSELPIFIPSIHPEHCWGTPDWWRYDPIEQTLRVWDYKYGHLFVEVFECWQLIAYVAGIMDTLGLNDSETLVIMGIVQPRSYHPEGPVRTWVTRGDAIRQYVNVAFNQAHIALAPNPPATTGTHCEFCPGRHECRTLQLATQSICDFTGTIERVNLPAPALASELRILDEAHKLLKARRTGLQAQAEAVIRRGERVPGYAMVAAEGRLNWAVPTDEVIAMGDLMGVNLRKPSVAITPTQAKKLKIDAGVISQYSARSVGAVKLDVDSTTQAKKVFS